MSYANQVHILANYYFPQQFISTDMFSIEEWWDLLFYLLF